MNILVSTPSRGGLSVHKLQEKTSARSFHQTPTPFTISGTAHASGASPIAHLTSFTRKNRQYVAILYHDAILQLYCRTASSGSPSPRFELVKQWPAHVNGRSDCVIGLVYTQGLLYTCSSRGTIVVRNLDDDDCNFSQVSVCISQGVLRSTLGREAKGLVQVFRVSPINPRVVAVAGQRLGLTVLELSLSLPLDGAPGETVLWRSKPERDVWIGDVMFLDGTLMAASTRFGRILIYDTAASSTPMVDLQVSHHPILAMRMLPKGLLFQDSCDLLGVIDTHYWRVSDEYRIPLMGSLSYLEVVDASTVLVSTLDRKLKLVRLASGEGAAVLDSLTFAAQVRQFTVFSNTGTLRRSRNASPSTKEDGLLAPVVGSVFKRARLL